MLEVAGGTTRSGGGGCIAAAAAAAAAALEALLLPPKNEGRLEKMLPEVEVDVELVAEDVEGV